MLVALPFVLRPVNNLKTSNSKFISNSLSLFVSDGFTFVKRHQAALIQRLKSVEPVLDHLREQNVLCMFMFFVCFSLRFRGLRVCYIGVQDIVCLLTATIVIFLIKSSNFIRFIVIILTVKLVLWLRAPFHDTALVKLPTFSGLS